MMPSQLIEVEGTKHFLTERFDRRDGEKIFTQTLAAVNPEADTYEALFETCRLLSIPKDEQNELFLRTVFNVLSNNTDDHPKNFSFIMDRNGNWHLSPAYDLCFILKNGTSAQKAHVFSIRGKHEDITDDDLKEFAIRNDIKNPAKYIAKVRTALSEFENLAIANGIAPFLIRIMKNRLHELSPEIFNTGDADIPQLLRFEITESSNIHLYATVDGKQRRRVITPRNASYQDLLSAAKSQLSEDDQKKIIRMYF